jgi:catechol 2,3-dioxygenase-like lactoylglutathione lyase family enzyme
MRTAASAVFETGALEMSPNSIRPVTFGRVAPGLTVRDIQAAYAFYSQILGFEKVFENGQPVGFMVLKKDAAEIHLSQKRDHVASTVNSCHMFVDDAAALYELCQAAGVRIIKSLQIKDYGQKAFVFADPDGNRIDVGERV